MPQRAIETGAVHYIAPPEMLARLLQAECAAPDLEVAC
jgi:chemotaxis response regulator CheB